MNEYTPKTSDAYERDLLASLVAFFGTQDLEEGAAERFLARGLSRILGRIDAKLNAIKRGRGLDARGRYLDDVVAQIMSARAIRRQPKRAAGGPALRLIRASGAGSLTIPVGSRVRSIVDSKLEYETSAEVTLVDGQTIWPGIGQQLIPIRCLTPGRAGDARPNTLRVVVSMPAGVVSVTNPVRVGGGEDDEEDPSLVARAKLLTNSLGRTNESALLSIARDYVAKAAVIRPARLGGGYAELVVSDPALTGLTRAATEVSDTVGSGGTDVIYFDGPAASEPRIALYTSTTPPEAIMWRTLAQWEASGDLPSGGVVLHERGEIELAGKLLTGTIWATGRHLVYGGVIATLQSLVEGSPDAGEVLLYGHRSASSRVRVRPAIPQAIALRCRATYRAGISRAEGNPILTEALAKHVEQIAIGGEFIIWDAETAMRSLDILTDFQLLFPLTNIRAADRRNSFVVSSVTVV